MGGKKKLGNLLQPNYIRLSRWKMFRAWENFVFPLKIRTYPSAALWVHSLWRLPNTVIQQSLILKMEEGEHGNTKTNTFLEETIKKKKKTNNQLRLGWRFLLVIFIKDWLKKTRCAVVISNLPSLKVKRRASQLTWLIGRSWVCCIQVCIWAMAKSSGFVPHQLVQLLYTVKLYCQWHGRSSCTTYGPGHRWSLTWRSWHQEGKDDMRQDSQLLISCRNNTCLAIVVTDQHGLEMRRMSPNAETY